MPDMIGRLRIGLLLLAAFALRSSANGAPHATQLPTLRATQAQVKIGTEGQKLVFTRAAGGAFRLATYVRDGERWRALFDAGRPLLEGPLFDLEPVRFDILSDTRSRKAVRFGGRHKNPDYDWTLCVEASAASPLLRLDVRCRLPEPLTLHAPQPVVALWMRRRAVPFHLDQGPDSIYGSTGIPNLYGIPAAYLWNGGLEAALFFNMTPMRWMQAGGVARFNDVRIMSRSEEGCTGLGMFFKKLSGRRIPAGEMRIELFLLQSARPRRPSGMEALDRMVHAFAPLHPARSQIPRNRLTGAEASWEQIADHTIADLMNSPRTIAEILAPWRDERLPLAPTQERMVVHPAQATADATRTASDWDFSTVNNHLTPWLLLARLKGNTRALRLGLMKRDALPRFYDPRAGLIRHGTRCPAHVGDLDMAWQSFFFHEETLRADAAAGPGMFNPAPAGRFLMATKGLREFARNVDYVFPQWFDPYRKLPIVQNDVKQLGMVREPWQVGEYAYLMLQAFDITGDRDYFAEARRSVETLMERMKFRLKNQVYDRSYTDPAEFPITELFGNAWGIAASYRLYEATGERKFLRYSRGFLNTLLRLTPWYEDETDPICRDLPSAGLFFPHGGSQRVTPWETSEAHLMIAWTLKHDRANPLTALLLKLSNLNRINSFYFFPAVWTDRVRALDPVPRPALGEYFPMEGTYRLEAIDGDRGPTAAYMAGLALWNDWLYEALAAASDHDILVLNLDAMEDYEAAVSGLERHFLIYNPATTARRFRVLFRRLPNADYLVTAGPRTARRRAAELRSGLPMRLGPGQCVRIRVRRSDWRMGMRRLKREETTHNAMIHAYQTRGLKPGY
jgi:hypothetical protein